MQKIKELEAKQKAEQLAKLKNEDLERKKREQVIRSVEDKKKAQQRGKQAISKEIQNLEKVKNYERDRRNVDKKEKIKQIETEIARVVAEDFREREKERIALEEIEKKREQASKVYSIDKNGNKIDNCIQTNSAVDYTNTFFHNAFIVKHDTDISVSTSKSFISKSAFESAEDHQNYLEKTKLEKMAHKIRNDRIAEERGKAALEKTLIKQIEFDKKKAYQPDREILRKRTKQIKMESEVEKILSVHPEQKPVKPKKAHINEKKKTEELIQKNTINKVENFNNRLVLFNINLISRNKAGEDLAEQKQIKNKSKPIIMMPEIVFEENVEDEKSECDVCVEKEAPKFNEVLTTNSLHISNQIKPNIQVTQTAESANQAMNLVYQQLLNNNQIAQYHNGYPLQALI
jgi:hypothetical protein